MTKDEQSALEKLKVGLSTGRISFNVVSYAVGLNTCTVHSIYLQEPQPDY
jgi:hypothetical protein